MRVVSLDPAVTEWIDVLDAWEVLVGRTHRCPEPPGDHDTSVLTRENSEPAQYSAVHEYRGLEHMRSFKPSVGADRVRELEPDVVIFPTWDWTGRRQENLWEDVIADLRSDGVRCIRFGPSTLKDVLDGVLRITRGIGCLDRGMELIGDLEKQLHRLRQQLGLVEKGVDSLAERPRVVPLHRVRPFWVAGRWMPDIIEQAGGEPLFLEPGARSCPIDWSVLRNADPDLLLLAIPGLSVREMQDQLDELSEFEKWADLRAVQAGNVYLFDANTYYTEPTSRLYRGIGLLATALHGDRVPTLEPSVQDWEYQVFHHLPTASP